MSGPNDPSAWLEKVAEDLLAMEGCGKVDPIPWAMVCYHAQQAAEKLLKAYIVSRSRDPRRTHDLVALLGEAVALEPTLTSLVSDCQLLAPYAERSRYPTSDGFKVGKLEGEQATLAVQRIRSRLLPLIDQRGA